MHRRNETNDDLAAEVDELKARLVAQVGDRSAAREATKQAQQQEKDELLAEEAELNAANVVFWGSDGPLGVEWRALRRGGAEDGFDDGPRGLRLAVSPYCSGCGERPFRFLPPQLFTLYLRRCALSIRSFKSACAALSAFCCW